MMSANNGPVSALVPTAALPYLRSGFSCIAVLAGYALGLFESSKAALGDAARTARSLDVHKLTKLLLYGSKGSGKEARADGKHVDVASLPPVSTSKIPSSETNRDKYAVGPTAHAKGLDHHGAPAVLSSNGVDAAAKSAVQAKKAVRKPNGDHLPPDTAASVQTVTASTPVLSAPPQHTAAGEAQQRSQVLSGSHETGIVEKYTVEASAASAAMSLGSDDHKENARDYGAQKRPRKVLRKIKGIFRGN